MEVKKWGSKLQKIVTIIHEILDEDPSAKILIYSQWNDSLILLSYVLKEIEIPYCFMTKANNYRSTIEFKNDNKIKVLLLLLQQGNNGLDMSIATHIIIMEPILSASRNMK